MRTINIDGRLGKDAELNTSPNGRKYVRFSVANNAFIGGKEDLTWYDVSCFDPFVIEKKFDLLKKGTYVNITGPFQIKENIKDGKLYLNHYITANSVEIPKLGKGGDNSESDNGFKMTTGASRYDSAKFEAQMTPSPVPATASFNSQDDDDELPF